MKKWQELTINSFMNLSIALIAGGVLKLFWILLAL